MNLKVRANVLRELVSQLVILTEECKLVVDKDGLHTKLVDPAHVAMADLYLDKEAFEEFKMDGEVELGIDIRKILEILKLCGTDTTLGIEHDEEHKKLIFTIGNLTRRMALVDTAGMSDPRIPNLDLPGKVILDTEHMVQAMKAIASVSDHCILIANMHHFEIVGEGDTDNVELSLPKDLLLDLECKETVRSLFPLDYMGNMIKAIPAKEVTIYLGNDYPVKMQFSWAEPPKPKETDEKGDGRTTFQVDKSQVSARGKTTYLLAPRIESD